MSSTDKLQAAADLTCASDSAEFFRRHYVQYKFTYFFMSWAVSLLLWSRICRMSRRKPLTTQSRRHLGVLELSDEPHSSVNLTHLLSLSLHSVICSAFYYYFQCNYHYILLLYRYYLWRGEAWHRKSATGSRGISQHIL